MGYAGQRGVQHHSAEPDPLEMIWTLGDHPPPAPLWPEATTRMCPRTQPPARPVLVQHLPPPRPPHFPPGPEQCRVSSQGQLGAKQLNLPPVWLCQPRLPEGMGSAPRARLLLSGDGRERSRLLRTEVHGGNIPAAQGQI